MATWLNNAVFYEIYPQTFCDSNGDGIGDIPGAESKLPYIRDLGCNAIWLNPCFASPFYDAGYDVSDFLRIAPRYGTNDDMCRFFKTAHELGIHVLLDLVPGHTSVEHKWFRESAKADRNEYTDRYVWTNNTWSPPQNKGYLNGCFERNGCVVSNYFSIQPALNYGYGKITAPWQQKPSDPGPRATVRAMTDVILFWLGLGCDGFRIDMAGSLVKDDEEQAETIRIWQEIFAEVHTKYPESAFVSEWGNPARALKGGFDMDFLLHFGPSHYNELFRTTTPYFSRRGEGNVRAVVDFYREIQKSTGGKGLVCIPSGNHDMPRLARTLDTEESKLAFAFLLSLPGAPFLYYGDEIGMRYLENLKSVEGGFERTGSRTPMQWDNTPSAGFSDAAPEQFYLPLDPAADRPTVENQESDPNSLLNEVKKLIRLRLDHKVLCSDAEIEFLYAEEKAYPLVYRRKNADDSVVVILNPANRQVMCDIPVKGEVIYRYGGTALLGERLTVDPATAVFVREI